MKRNVIELSERTNINIHHDPLEYVFGCQQRGALVTLLSPHRTHSQRRWEVLRGRCWVLTVLAEERLAYWSQASWVEGLKRDWLAGWKDWRGTGQAGWVEGLKRDWVRLAGWKDWLDGARLREGQAGWEEGWLSDQQLAERMEQLTREGESGRLEGSLSSWL